VPDSGPNPALLGTRLIGLKRAGRQRPRRAASAALRRLNRRWVGSKEPTPT
jgi:hypothetical protein